MLNVGHLAQSLSNLTDFLANLSFFWLIWPIFKQTPTDCVFSSTNGVKWRFPNISPFSAFSPDWHHHGVPCTPIWPHLAEFLTQNLYNFCLSAFLPIFSDFSPLIFKFLVHASPIFSEFFIEKCPILPPFHAWFSPFFPLDVCPFSMIILDFLQHVFSLIFHWFLPDFCLRILCNCLLYHWFFNHFWP